MPALRPWLLTSSTVAALLLHPRLNADPVSDEIRLLKEQLQSLSSRLAELEQKQTSAPPGQPAAPSLEELDQKLKILDRQRELSEEAAAERAKTTPVVSLGANGFSVRSADTNFVFRFRGYVQGDARFFLDDPATSPNDTFLLRRVRPIFEGTVFDRFDYRVMLDFGTGQSSSANNIGWVQDAYVNARILPELQLRVGKDKEPVGLERLQSGANLLFVERAFPTLLVPNRDVGLQLRGDIGSGLFEYQIGVFNGVPDGGSGDADRSDEDKDFVGRIFTQPFRNTDGFFRGLGVGVAGTYGDQAGPLRGYFTPGQQSVFNYFSGSGTAASPAVSADGLHWRITPQAWFYRGPFGVLAEYVISNQDLRRTAGPTTVSANVENTAWQVAASYFLTGEENGFRAVSPRRPFGFGPESGWGAFELAARVSGLDIDDSIFPAFANPDQAIRGAFEWTVGANWHLNRHVKLQLNYTQAEFDGASQNALASDGERVLFGRVQFGF